MNVFDYFTLKLGEEPVEYCLRELEMNTPCGRDCVAAIDAASAFLSHVETAGVRRVASLGESIRATCENVCVIYWRG